MLAGKRLHDGWAGTPEHGDQTQGATVSVMLPMVTGNEWKAHSVSEGTVKQTD
jgi:hypothetical protein